MALEVARICAFCFDIAPLSSFPADRRSYLGKAHYCQRCIDEIVSDKIYRIGNCIICGLTRQINRKVCKECKQIIVMVNTQTQFWDRRAQFSKLMWLTDRIQRIPFDASNDSSVIAYRVKLANIRANMNGYPGLLDFAEVEYLWMIQNGICAYTGGIITLREAHLDHIVPLARGGRNTIGNVVFVRDSINLRKNTKTVEEFCAYAGLSYIRAAERLAKIGKELIAVGFIRSRKKKAA
jgi:5-methylcytosine-specific restriction endonuclease McrA